MYTFSSKKATMKKIHFLAIKRTTVNKILCSLKQKLKKTAENERKKHKIQDEFTICEYISTIPAL